MNESKSTTLSLRIDSKLKEALQNAAKLEHRSITNMVEVLIRDYCLRNKIQIKGLGICVNDLTNIGDGGLVTEK